MLYKKKLIFIFAIVFVCCSVGLIALEFVMEQNYKRSVLQAKLEVYADMVADDDSSGIICAKLSQKLRITILNLDGQVRYDSYESSERMENHSLRPEIQSSMTKNEGYCIRFSETTSKKHIYYAKKYADKNEIVRVSLPFELEMEKYFRPDWILWVSIILSFGIVFLLFIILSTRYDRKVLIKEEENKRALKHQMTSNIAHELRTPVSSIRGYLETLVDNPQMNAETKELFLERSYLQTIRLSDLIRDIALITKMEESPELFSIENVDMKIVVNDVFEEFGESLAQSEMFVENLVSQSFSIMGNYPLLYALIRNLVENSVKYAGQGSTIHIECEEVNGNLHFLYYDTGQGVPEYDLARIFERFYRSGNQNSKSNDGSGLGLSIVRNAVVFHQGAITAQNRNAGGLEFHFTLCSQKNRG